MEKHLSELNLPPNKGYLRRNWLYAILTAPVVGGIANWRSIYEMFFPRKVDITEEQEKRISLPSEHNWKDYPNTRKSPANN